MICEICKIEYEKWIPEGGVENNLCPGCNEKQWKEWKEENKEELKQIEEIQNQDHPHHCACRQVWGDGECECDLYKQGYDPYRWMKNKSDANNG